MIEYLESLFIRDSINCEVDVSVSVKSRFDITLGFNTTLWVVCCKFHLNGKIMVGSIVCNHSQYVPSFV